MEETRQDYRVGASTGYGWRDSHQFSFELNSLVLQYMANPAAYDNLTGGISDADQCVYPELRTQGEDEPDIVWLIKFGAMRYYDWGVNQNVQPHILIKEQLAYFLYVYPYISKWVDREFYENVRDYTIAQWGVNSCNKQWYPVSNTNHDLYALQTAFGGLKGSQPPGHSIIPNLMMYEVALRDGLGEDVAQKFFDAAYINCEYLVSDDFDITDPYYNKGQRMSEHVTMEALAYFLELYPDQAPAGLLDTITQWAEANVARTDNLWDIRMAVAPSDLDKGYTFHTGGNAGKPVDQVYWTGAAYAIADGQNPAPKNEPGNQGGLQAIAYAASRVLEDEELKAELEIMGTAAIDDLFGRNPTGRAAFYDLTRDFAGGDLGWWTQPTGGYGDLHQCTAVIDANAPESCYPYAPENYNTGYTEGWVAYNTAWNESLAYSSADATDLSVSKTSGKSGEEITITLDAPLNLDDAVVETGYVWVTDASGNAQQVAVTENAAAGTAFTGTYTLSNSTPYITVSYGIGLFEQSVQVTVEDFQYVDVESVTVTGGRDLAVGEKLQLTAEVKPDNATIKDVTWTSSDDTVLTVSASGLVTALKEGSATITATGFGGVKGTCSITVTAAAPASLTVEAPETLSIFDGTGSARVTSVVYTDGTAVTENLPAAVFASDNEAVLTVSADGTLTPVAAGEATVTATAEVDGRTVTGSNLVEVTAEKEWDLLNLSESGKVTVSGGASTTVVQDTSLKVDRLKLVGGQQGGTVSMSLGEMPEGTYEITLNSKFYSSYGSWSFEVNGQTVGKTIDFNDAEKNGRYYDVTLGEITLESAGDVTFSFISGNGKDLVPVSLTLEKVESPIPREVEITSVNRDGETVTGTSVNLEDLKVEVIVDGDLNQRYVAETLDEAGNWQCVFTLPADGTYVIQASIRDYSDFSQIIQTVPDDNYFEVEGREVWGATVTEGPDGLYYMIFSTWHNTQGFSNDWAVYSELGYAVSTSPDGPFVYQGLALDANYTNTTNTEPVYWEGVGTLEVFHNPTLMHSEKDGKYYLYFMGTNATEGGYTYAYGRNHQRIGVAVADTPAGPWTVYDKPVIDVREGMFDSLLTSNPSVTEVKNPDGTYTYYTVYKGVSSPTGKPLDGNDIVVSGCGYSDSPFGPFTRSEEAIMQNPTDGWSVEDCFLWSSNGKFYALAKDFKNYFTGVTGYPYSYALFESSDGMTDWAVSDNALAFVTEIPWESGTQTVSHLERAQIYLEDGVPFLLCCATTKDGQSPYNGHAPYNVQIPLLGVVLAEDSESLTVTGLGDGAVDKTHLEEEIALAEQAAEELFTDEGWAKFQSALRAARLTAADEDASEEDVAFYAAELEEALENQMDPSEVHFNIVRNKPAEGTNTYTHSAAGDPVSGYEADKAVDGDTSTRWATQEPYTESILTVDLQGTYRMDRFSITQYKGTQDGMNSRIQTYTLEYFDGSEWKVCYSGTADSTVIKGTLDQPVYGEKVRLVLGDDSSLAPSIYEFEVYGVAYEEDSTVPVYQIKTEAEHGTVKANPSWAWAGQKVQLTIQPDEGYVVDSVTVTDSRGKDVAVSGNTFTMPNGSVTVRVTFKAEESEPLFPDVPADAWYSEAVAWAVEQGVMKGVSGGLFDPDGAVTRATVWAVLARMAGEETDGGESWYAKAQAWAVAEGISDGTNPEGTITREQLAAMLYRYSGSPETAADLSGYPDSGDVSDWAADAMVWAVETSLITGGDGGKLLPGAGTDRAQLATILMRFAQQTEA
ncbi:Endoglucanase precursor [uncultured Flavonifractor sp.]|nr:Endoglucanase precursor [uncultured Flavonifractor sp.]